MNVKTLLLFLAELFLVKNGDKFVRIVGSGEIISEIKVVTGLKGTMGQTEIIEGIAEGDKIITIFKKRNKNHVCSRISFNFS